MLGPGGSSTNPSVPASAVKSPEPLVGQGSAEVRPQSSLLQLHRQIERERRLHLDGRGERDARALRRAPGPWRRAARATRNATGRPASRRDCPATRTPPGPTATRRTTSACRAAAPRDGTPGRRRASPAPSARGRACPSTRRRKGSARRACAGGNSRRSVSCASSSRT